MKNDSHGVDDVEGGGDGSRQRFISESVAKRKTCDHCMFAKVDDKITSMKK